MLNLKIIIIGAGILGVSTAYQLAKSGVEVIVVDREDAGRATDAAAGIICPWVSQRRNKAWYALAKGGAAYYSSLIKQLEEDGEMNTGYRKVGAISLHTEMEKLEKLEKRAVIRREDAPEMGGIQQLNSGETTALFPPLSETFSSVLIEGAARVNGQALRQALVNASVKNGATFIVGSAEIIHSNNKVSGVKVNGKSYSADTVIITAGAWAEELLTPLGINLQIKAQKAQIVHLQIDEKETEDWPVVMPPTNHYLLAFDDGKIIVGATHEDDMNFDQRITAGGLYEVFDKALAIAPGLADATFTEARVGYRPFTANFLPVIGEIPDYQGLLFANGLGASGLTVGPFLGDQLAKLALGQKLDIDIELYDVSLAIEK